MKVINRSFVPPFAIELAYRRAITKLIRGMIKDYRALFGLYREKKSQMAMDATQGEWLTTAVQERLNKLGKLWDKKFKEFAEAQSVQMVNKVLKSTDLQLKSILKDYFAAERFELLEMPVALKQVVKAHVAENVALIRSIPSQYLLNVQGALVRAITDNGSIRQFELEVAKYSRKEMSRAKLIAHDQLHKVFTTMVARRCSQLGIKRMMWHHSNVGKEPRPYHKRKWDGVSGVKDGHPNGLNGFIFELANLPVIQEADGKQKEIRGLPSQLINCRCFMRPIIE